MSCLGQFLLYFGFKVIQMYKTQNIKIFSNDILAKNILYKISMASTKYFLLNSVPFDHFE